MKRSKKKEIKRRQRPVCGLCGSKGKLTKTECCGQWICDDEDQYVPFTYARNSCHRNHSRYTLCGYHDAEGHKGDWKKCKQCREDFSDDLEMYVEYGTNEYNFEKLPNPPAFEPTYCSECGELIVKANGGYSVQNGVCICAKCNSGPFKQLNKFNPLTKLGLDDFDDDEDWDEDFDDEDRPMRLGPNNIDDISEEMIPRFEAVALLINQFCGQHKAFELSLLCVDMTLSLCVQFPEVIRRGKPESWACGIVHAIGMVNFLSDPDSEPYIETAEIYSFFGVSQGTMQSKSKRIRDLFGIFQMDPIWSLPELLLENPLLWTVPLNGLLVDIRDASQEMQQKALDANLIPMLPDTLKQHIRKYKEAIANMVKSRTQDLAVPEPAKKESRKSNIRIADYLSEDSKHSTPEEELPLFDTPEKE